MPNTGKPDEVNVPMTRAFCVVGTEPPLIVNWAVSQEVGNALAKLTEPDPEDVDPVPHFMMRPLGNVIEPVVPTVTGNWLKLMT